ncbi:MAG: DegT/DnrJ/EryC1/StrS aminotransferase family protein [bacterium]
MPYKLAVDGGSPVREEFLPYSKPVLAEEDVAAAVEVLKSGWLTTGPAIPAFERALAKAAGAKYAVAVSSCTAALHIAYRTVPLQAGDEVVVPALTFAATASAAAAAGGRPVIADVGDDLNIDPEDVARKVGPKTRALAAVHFGGLPFDVAALQEICRQNELALVQDCAHALGAAYRGEALGGRGYAACYSFHAVKQIAAGEGGAVTTDDAALAAKARLFRNHFLTTSATDRHGPAADYRYDVAGLGYNYRMPDLNAALALSQLGRFAADDARRQAVAAAYDNAFLPREDLEIIPTPPNVRHGRHLYIVKLRLEALKVDRDAVFRALRAENVGVNVHYIPLHYHSYYRDAYGYRRGDFPRAEALFERILSLPLFAAITARDVADVVTAVDKVLRYYRR